MKVCRLRKGMIVKMNILVINCGSSSLKFQLINSESEEVIAKGLCERIGIEGSCLTYTPQGGEKQKTEAPMADHRKDRCCQRSGRNWSRRTSNRAWRREFLTGNHY